MKHCILVKYNSTVGKDDKKPLQERISALFDNLLNVEGIHGVEVIPNVTDRPNRYDLLIRIDMDAEALETYDACETHKLWKKQYAQYLESKAIFDYEE